MSFEFVHPKDGRKITFNRNLTFKKYDYHGNCVECYTKDFKNNLGLNCSRAYFIGIFYWIMMLEYPEGSDEHKFHDSKWKMSWGYGGYENDHYTIEDYAICVQTFSVLPDIKTKVMNHIENIICYEYENSHY